MLERSTLYVQETAQFTRRIIGKVNRNTALRMPAAQALRVANRIIRRTGQVIELRSVDPTEGSTARGQP